ncbi:hypothetical protein GCM10025876_22590 [Demequina litorisediminis]|uniref:Helix-turn-helix domain-containing protein n=2 Tax=Demequina TaxID=577469 RepID=A0ABQ6IE06_9MICO|nr:hypothetical protein GCM10025876_22590 [Demequina litorisediminis]
MTVYRWVHAGEIPAVQFGRSYRVPRAAVEQFMEQAGYEGFSHQSDDRRSGTVG